MGGSDGAFLLEGAGKWGAFFLAEMGGGEREEGEGGCGCCCCDCLHCVWFAN